MILRDARPEDLPAIDAIYDHYVHTSTCTAQHAPAGIRAREAWFSQHGRLHPIVVVEVAGRVAGWGSLSPYREREGYSKTVEDSIYLDAERRGHGVGSLVLAHLLERARSLEHRVVVAGISGDQIASVRLHAKHGFEQVGRLRGVVNKFGLWLDVVFMQRSL